MAKIAGFQMKNVKNTLGREGYGYTGTVYLNNEKIGIYEDWGDGGSGDCRYVSKDAEQKMVLFLVQYGETHPNKYILKMYQKEPERVTEEKERFLRCFPYVDPKMVTENVLSNHNLDCLVYDFIRLYEAEKEYKKAVKKGYSAVAVCKKNGQETMYDIPDGWTDERIQADLATDGIVQENIRIYRSLDDFIETV